MRELFGAVLGVPATILIAAGGGIALVTVVSRIRRKRFPPMRWSHGFLGLGVLGAGALLFELDLTVIGLR
jgi:hypothetical protein